MESDEIPMVPEAVSVNTIAMLYNLIINKICYY